MAVRYWHPLIVGAIIGVIILGGGQVRGEGAAVARASRPASQVALPVTDAYQTIVTGSDLKNIFITQDQTGAEPVIGFTLNDAGAARLWMFTSANIGQPLAIVIDKKVISTPIIQAPTSSEGVIAGSFTLDEAKELVRTMKQGVTTFEIIDPRGAYLEPGTTVVTTGTPAEQLATPVVTPDTDSRGGR